MWLRSPFPVLGVGVQVVCLKVLAKTGRGSIISAGREGQVKLWDARSGAIASTLFSCRRGEYLLCMDYLEHAGMLAAAGTEGCVPEPFPLPNPQPTGCIACLFHCVTRPHPVNGPSFGPTPQTPIPRYLLGQACSCSAQSSSGCRCLVL